MVKYSFVSRYKNYIQVTNIVNVHVQRTHVKNTGLSSTIMQCWPPTHNTHTHTGGEGRGSISFRQKKAAAFGGEATPPRTLRGHEEKKNVYLAVSSATLASVSRSKNSPIDCVCVRERERCMSVIEGM